MERRFKLALQRERGIQWTSSFILACLVFFGSLTGILANSLQQVGPLLIWIRYGQTATAAFFLVLLWIYRKRSHLLLTVSTYLILVLPFYLTSTLYHFENLRLHDSWQPFMGHKLFFLALSILVPGPYWINILLMAGFAVQCTALWWFTNAADRVQFIAAAEPWVTILYFVVAATLLGFRSYYEKLIGQLALAEANSEMLTQMTRIFLSVRDLANTPLQNLEISTELLKQKHANPDEIADRVRNAVNRLNSLNRIFTYFEARIPWAGKNLMGEEEILGYLKDLQFKADALSSRGADV